MDRYRDVMDVNYFSAVAGTLAVLPAMLERRHGSSSTCRSDSGRAPGPRDVVYGASKAALSAFTEALSFTAEDNGVHLHVLYPGWVPTAMGSGAVDAGMAMPPRAVRRTEEQVSRARARQDGWSQGGHRRHRGGPPGARWPAPLLPSPLPPGRAQGQRWGQII